MKKTIQQILLLLSLTFLLSLPYLVFAQTNKIGDALVTVGKDSGFTEADEFTLSAIAGQVVSVALSLLGIIFIILIIYAGVRWMTAQGNESEISVAKNILKNSIIGLIIVVSAYAIYALVSRIIYVAP